MDTLLFMVAQSSNEEAVHAALTQNWKEAIRINTEILKEKKESVEALSRLAYAYMKTGQIPLAKKTYEKVIKLDQYNHIALKNIKKLDTIKKRDPGNDNEGHLSPLMFLEEPGKTKIVECIHLAPNQVLSTLSAGAYVLLKIKNHCIEIRTQSNTYLAALPDDMSFKLSKLMSAGNTYQAIVKSIEKNSLKVLIRELSRGKRFAHQPSFTSTTSYIPFAKGGSSSSAGESPDMTPTGEDSDGNDSAEEPDTES